MTRRRKRSRAYNAAYNEAEANAFASHLLVPSILLQKDLRELNPDLICDEDIKTLANKYQVPIFIMAVRIQEELEEMLDNMY